MEVTVALLYCFIAFILYKIVDRLVRIPRIGNYSNRYIFVTGCDTGFGHEICKRLDKMGCHVFAGCLTEKGETQLKKTCSNRLQTISLDVTKSSSITNAYNQVEKALPLGKGLWGIINNAGIGGDFGPIELITMDMYQKVIGINLLGVIECTTKFLPLVKREKGRIVNTASMIGRCGLENMAPYAATKYGVEGFSDSIRRQLRKFGISVHLIEPGFFKTNIINLEALEKRIRDLWAQAPEHTRQEYGQQYLDAFIEQNIKTLLPVVGSERIYEVIDAYEHALLGTYPRARYVLGYDARFFFIPICCWLPEWLGDWVLDRDPNKPIPSVLNSST